MKPVYKSKRFSFTIKEASNSKL